MTQRSEGVREFEDAEGGRWTVGVRAHPGTDYKGRYVFVASPESDPEGRELLLDDVRWNSERTARRTLETMSVVELSRRVAWARGRSSGPSRSTAPSATE